jgi:nucleoporin NUP42
MRVRAYILRSQGKPQEIVSEASTRFQTLTRQTEIEAAANKKMTDVVSNIVNDTAAAIRYVQKGEEEHPNRWDVSTASTAGELDKLLSGNPTQTGLGQGPIAQASNATASPFAQATSNASPFGQASKPTNSLFGQPSMAAASPFGAVSNANASPFGQASTLGNNNSPFGKPSTLGGGGGFGQPANLGQPTPFGQTSSLNNTASPFARASQPQASPFGQPANAPQAPAATANTNNSPFGNAAQSNTTTSPFGQPSMGNANNSPFAQNNSSPFATKTASSANPFGSSSPFAQANQPNNSNQSGSPFGQNNAASNSSPFAARTNNANNGFVQSGSSNLATNSKIFPAGVPTAALCEDPPAYQFGDNESIIKEVYEKVKQTATFSDGTMPMVAPKFEWVAF